MAKSALLNSLGEKLQHNISVTKDSLTLNNSLIQFDDLLITAFQNNPTWRTLEIAQSIFENKVDEAISGYLPKVGLMGSLSLIENSYKYGLVSDKNKFNWTVGLGVQMPLFNGFRTSAEVDEANYRLEKIKSQKKLLENGLEILVKKGFVEYSSASDQLASLKSAMISATENCELNDRAYQSELVELKDLLEAQLFEAIMKVQYYKAQFTYYEALAELEFTIGKNIN